jgi:hypothetical protein
MRRPTPPVRADRVVLLSISLRQACNTGSPSRSAGSGRASSSHQRCEDGNPVRAPFGPHCVLDMCFRHSKGDFVMGLPFLCRVRRNLTEPKIVFSYPRSFLPVYVRSRHCWRGCWHRRPPRGPLHSSPPRGALSLQPDSQKQTKVGAKGYKGKKSDYPALKSASATPANVCFSAGDGSSHYALMWIGIRQRNGSWTEVLL